MQMDVVLQIEAALSLIVPGPVGPFVPAGAPERLAGSVP
jgi:hypothetical protein